MKINSKLAKERGLTLETIAEIEHLQEYRKYLENERLQGNLSQDSFYSKWTTNEFALQRLWGFSEDAKYHRFWDAKGCTCPKMDNDDAYPTGYYIVNRLCPLHGNDK